MYLLNGPGANHLVPNLFWAKLKVKALNFGMGDGAKLLVMVQGQGKQIKVLPRLILSLNTDGYTGQHFAGFIEGGMMWELGLESKGY